MEAVIVAGGLGTRLRPLTQHRPKHLIPVGGVPFVVHQLAKLAAVGVDHVVLATSYHSELFEPVLGDGSTWRLKISYVTEPAPLGTAGAIRNVTDALLSGPDDPVVVLNGDILSGHDLAAQVDVHESRSADVTLHLVEVPDARSFGCVPTDDEGRVLGFMEKSPDPVTHQINAGCYVFRRAMIDQIPPGRVVSLERETFPRLLADDRRVLGVLDPAYWLDLGTPEALVRASSDLVRGIATSPAYEHPSSEAWIDPGARVDPVAHIRGGSAVSAGASVGVRALLEGSVVLEGAEVAAGARVIDSIVAAGARVGARVVLRDAVVGEHAVVGAGCELIGGARVWSDTTIPDGGIRFSPDV
ncbi:MAG: sugar phosphate nucleotidyltransferase [Nocardioidaceae bacterium]